MGIVDLLLCLCLGAHVTYGLTNSEFYNLFKDHLTDEVIEPLNGESNDVTDTTCSDVITLPGGPDDEVDLVLVLERMGFTPSDGSTYDTRSVGCWHRRHHHHHHHHHRHHHHHHHHHHRHHHHHHHRNHCRHHSTYQPCNVCVCTNSVCGCCAKNTFQVRLHHHVIKFKVEGCVGVAYERKTGDYRVELLLNGQQLMHSVVPLDKTPRLCYRIPNRSCSNTVCLQFYDVHLHNRSMCSRLDGNVTREGELLQGSLRLGCFTIPLDSKDDVQPNLSSYWEPGTDWNEDGAGDSTEAHEYRPSSDMSLLDAFRVIQTSSNEKQAFMNDQASEDEEFPTDGGDHIDNDEDALKYI